MNGLVSDEERQTGSTLEVARPVRRKEYFFDHSDTPPPHYRHSTISTVFNSHHFFHGNSQHLSPFLASRVQQQQTECIHCRVSELQGENTLHFRLHSVTLNPFLCEKLLNNEIIIVGANVPIALPIPAHTCNDLRGRLVQTEHCSLLSSGRPRRDSQREESERVETRVTTVD